MNKYLIAALIVSVGFVGFSSGIAIAETKDVTKTKMSVNINSSGHATLDGAVELVGTDSITVKSWGGSWVVKIVAKTKINNATKVLADFKVGDRVSINGKALEGAAFTVEAKTLRSMMPRAIDKKEDRKEKGDKDRMEGAIKVPLSSQNNSGISGVATLKEDDGKLVVKIELKGAPAGAFEPAHIHMGVCPTPGDVKYSLSTVVNGKSESTLSATMADIKAGLPLAINVHKSAEEISSYVACGNVKL